MVLHAKSHECFFNADDDKDLAKAIIDVKKEIEQFDDLLNGDSILFKSARWKVFGVFGTYTFHYKLFVFLISDNGNVYILS